MGTPDTGYTLPKGYSYLFGLNAGKGVVSLVESGYRVIDAVYRLETETDLSEALTRLAATATSREADRAVPFRERSATARSIHGNLSRWLEEKNVPFQEN